MTGTSDDHIAMYAMSTTQPAAVTWCNQPSRMIQHGSQPIHPAANRFHQRIDPLAACAWQASAGMDHHHPSCENGMAKRSPATSDQHATAAIERWVVMRGVPAVARSA